MSVDTISDLHASWDALLKAAPTAYVTRWPAWSEVTSKPTWIGANKPSYAFSEITGKPTTLGGYGITDAYTKTEADGRYVNVSGDTMTGNLTLKPLGGLWLSGKTQAPIMTNGASSTTGNTYHPIIWGKTTAGDVWNLGHGASDQVGFFGFYSERTANGTDWSTYIEVSTGVFYQSKAMNVTGLITATAGLTTPQYIQIGSGRIKWDSSNNALYVEKSDGTAIGFYSKGFISAKGANDDAGGTVSGVTKLSDLSDVQLGTLATNQVLSWNGSKWVNKTLEVGLDETALAQYLTNNQYLTMPTGDERYVTISTDQTITGKKTFANSIYFKYNTDTSRVYSIYFNNTSNTVMSSIGYHNEPKNFYLNPMGSSEPWNDAVGKYSLFVGNNKLTYNTYPILTSNNYAATLDTRYVKKSGGTMTGELTIKTTNFGEQLTIYRNNSTANSVINYSNSAGLLGIIGVCGSGGAYPSQPYFNNGVADYKIWTSGNDGSGSGLDADLLDGLHLGDIRNLGYTMQKITIDASSLNADTWYPVTINLNSNHSVLIALIVSLDSGTKPSWSTHSAGFSVRKVWYTNGDGWGVNTINRLVLFSDYRHASSDPVRGIGQMNNSSNEYVYVRGGGRYHFYVSHGVIPVLRSSTYTIYEQSVSPTMTAPAAISRTNALITDNVYSATQLQTAQKIWGQPFDGTAPVSGNMTEVGTITSSGGIAKSWIDVWSGGGANHPWYGLSLNGPINNYQVTLSGYYGMTFHTSSGWLTMLSNGDVGIGTTSPSYKLHVVGSSYIGGGVTASGSFATSNGNVLQYNVYSNKNLITWEWTSTYGDAVNFYIPGTNSQSVNMKLYANGGLLMNGLIHATGGIYSDSYVSAKGNNSSSDIRLKNILCHIRPSLKAFAKAPLFRFAWKSDPGMVEIGSSAQYWRNVLPDTVKERDGWLEMGYGNIALAGVITIAREMETLEQRVDRLEKENGKLKKKIKELERRAI